MNTMVYARGLADPFPFEGTADEFRKLQPNHGGELRWEYGGTTYVIDTNVAPVVGLAERPS